MLAVVCLVTGCGGGSGSDNGKQAQPQETVGIIDINRAVQAHPQYSKYQELKNEINALEVQRQAMTTSKETGSKLSEVDIEGMNAAAAAEFNAKLEKKKAEGKAKLDAKEDELKQAMTGQMEKFAAELDQRYYLPIFNVQLKLKTVQLTAGETAELQQQLANLQQQRDQTLAAKRQELAAELDKAMNVAADQAGAEVDAYAKQLQTELAGQVAEQREQMSDRVPPPDFQGNVTETEQAITAKKQELDALDYSIHSDIKNKVAQVAIERGLTTVLANVAVNVHGVDVTDLVIAAFKK